MIRALIEAAKSDERFAALLEEVREGATWGQV